jgi:hypothetical protein
MCSDCPQQFHYNSSSCSLHAPLSTETCSSAALFLSPVHCINTVRVQVHALPSGCVLPSKAGQKRRPMSVRTCW